jgi:transcription initiation factor TFIID subunit 11
MVESTKNLAEDAPQIEGEEEEEEEATALRGLAAVLEEADGNGDIEREKMKLLLSNFNDDQMSRYEAFRRANVNRSAVKKLSNAILNQSITGNVAVALSGMSKVFVGEIVELARDVQARADPDNVGAPLRPEHLREAWRLYKLESGRVPAAHWRHSDGLGGLFR